MKKIAAVLLVMAMAGCSSMGMSSMGSSGRSGAGMGASGIDNRNAVIDPNGQLNIYHGG